MRGYLFQNPNTIEECDGSLQFDQLVANGPRMFQLVDSFAHDNYPVVSVPLAFGKHVIERDVLQYDLGGYDV